MEIVLDEGYMYGLGVFETMSVINNKCIFLEEHICRLNRSLSILGIEREVTEKEVLEYLDKDPMENGVLKIMVSDGNKAFTSRKNTYTAEQYEKGFVLGISSIIRNETSPFTYMKSFNYGDNILEKRRAAKNGWDEPLFLNSLRQICEGATTNIFFVKDRTIYTPPVSCGMLDGIVRGYVLRQFSVVEKIIGAEEVGNYDEAFVTNSLLGIMPVRQIGSIEFRKRDITNMIMEKYDSEKM